VARSQLTGVAQRAMHSLGPTSQEWTLVIALVSGMLLSVFAALPARTSTIVDGVGSGGHIYGS